MAKNTIKSNVRVQMIFDELDKYRIFCRDYGYRFDEAELYNGRSYVYRQFQKFIAGKPVKNQWEVDLARLKDQGRA